MGCYVTAPWQVCPSGIAFPWRLAMADRIGLVFAVAGAWVDSVDPNTILEPQDVRATWTGGDYHVKSRAGRWDPISRTWLYDTVISPCIDAGVPGGPVDSEPMPNGGVVNMGAYGGTSEAGKSP